MNDENRTPQRATEPVANAFSEMSKARTGLPWYGKVVDEARQGTASPREAIRAFCVLCVGEVKADITNCSAKQCPLWCYRPYQVPRRRG